jgi:hypothetical protein
MRHQDLDFLQTELSRVSGWIQFTDQKAGFIAVFYSAILGFLVTQREEISSHLFVCSLAHNVWVLSFLVMAVFLSVGIYHLFFTVLPKLRNTNTKKSFFYFGTIASMKLDDYQKGLEELSDEDVRSQLKEQIHTNSVIARTKMQSVKKSTFFLFWSGIIVFVLFII